MAPQITSDKVTRYVPPLTRDWLAQADRDRAGSGQFLLHDRQPVISDDRTLQVLNWTPTSVTLILWEEPSPTGSVPKVQVGTRPTQVERSDSLPVPTPARHELQDGGFVLPPQKILWLRVKLDPPLTKGQSIQVQVKSEDASNTAAKSVNLFTS
jgi:hypothetical protein